MHVGTRRNVHDVRIDDPDRVRFGVEHLAERRRVPVDPAPGRRRERGSQLLRVDLVDEAACVSLLYGADVHIVPKEHLPSGDAVAAQFRS